MKKIFCLHNPKAGGSSLRQTLAHLYKDDEIAPVFFNAPMDYLTQKETVANYRGSQLYWGHYGYDTFETLSDGHLLITNFRDPITRIISLYNFWRNNVRLETITDLHPIDINCVKQAHDLSFSEFIRTSDVYTKLYFNNTHFRQLYNSPWLDDAGPWHAHLLVKERIRRLHWFYVAELPEMSMRFFQKMFPEAAIDSWPRANKSVATVAQISSEDREHLIDLNRLDYMIYSYAIEALIERNILG